MGEAPCRTAGDGHEPVAGRPIAIGVGQSGARADEGDKARAVADAIVRARGLALGHSLEKRFEVLNSAAR